MGRSIINIYNCKVCGHYINLDEDGKGYCPICDKEVSKLDVLPAHWMDPIIQYCWDCELESIRIMNFMLQGGDQTNDKP